MPQMYKIYVNDTPLHFKELAPNLPLPADDDPQHLCGRYTGSPKTLLNYADMLEKGSRLSSVTLFTDNLEAIQRDFLSQFDLIEAAGGIVRSPEGKCLLIYRLGHWDLPKGKIEPGEAPDLAAVREVAEETGVSTSSLSFFDTTYHTYRSGKGKRIVKRTYWYRMEANEQPLIAQSEEGIESAIWAFPDAVLHDPDYVFYRSIRDLLESCVP